MRTEEMETMVGEVVKAVSTMSVKRVGALIVFEREAKLEDIIATGTPINSDTTADLLNTIFHTGTPLHDGAVVIRQGRVAAAACTLPLTASPRLDAAIHTRHKAALGMSEDSDAVVIVVSEETGTVSLAVDGKLIRGLRDDTLHQRLEQLLQIGDGRGSSITQVANRVGDVLKTARTVRRS
jgi:diadenylate cyclase